MKKISAFIISIAFALTATIGLSAVAAPAVMAVDSSSGASTPSVPAPDGGGWDDGGITQLEGNIYVKDLKTKILKPGTTMPFYFTLGSNGDGLPYDIRVSVDGAGDAAGMITLDTTTGWDDADLGVEKQRAIKVSPRLKDGTYRLVFNYKFMVDNRSMSQTETVTVYVQGGNQEYPFIKSTSFDKAQIGKENKAKLTAKIVNPMDTAMNDVRVSLNTEGSKGFTLYENYAPLTFDYINPGESRDAVFSTYIDPSVVSGNYPVMFDISYRDYRGNVISDTFSIYVQVARTPDADGGNDDKAGKPRIIVAKYSIDTDQIKAGQSFTLDFTLENTSGDKSLSNIKVVVDSESGKTSGTQTAPTSAVFFPAEGSNSFFIEKLGTKQQVSRSIKLMASQDVEPGVYPVILRLEYDSDSMAGITSEENISFPVNQEQRLDITGFTPPTDGMVGQFIPVNFQYINKGKATIYNFSVNIEGDFTLDGGDVYVGNLAAGFNDYFDSSISPVKEGVCKGAIVLKYEDSQGKQLEKKIDLSVNAMAMDMGGNFKDDSGMIGGVMPTPDGMMIDPKTGELVPVKKGPSVVMIVVIAAIVLAIAAVVFIVIKKKRKAKKGMMLDEED